MKSKVAKPLNVGAKIVFGFLAIIFVGAIILSLPISSKSGEFTSFLTSLFTATSATCVTGLVLVDTYTHWNIFGQAIILILIQIGGLGFMTMATLFSFILRRKITLKERMVMSSALNLSNMSGIVRLTKHVLLGTFLFEGIGAIILAARFYREFGFFGAVGRGIFHSVSAFCNAGFDLLGHENHFSSLTNYVHDPIINLTISFLIIVGGLGFFVWGDIYGRKRLSTHTKIVLIATTILIVSGWVLFFVFEYSNPNTIGDMTLSQKALAALFQSVTTRTAGFNTISQAGLTDPSLFVTYVLMFIGGSPGSTAGGIKTVTVAVLFIAAFGTVGGRTKFSFKGRSINIIAVMNALSIFFIGILCVFTGTIIMLAVEPYSFEAVVYEAISAFATVGLSFGITPELTFVSKVVLMILMFLGRVGILTLGFSLFIGAKKETKISYPEGIILIG